MLHRVLPACEKITFQCFRPKQEWCRRKGIKREWECKRETGVLQMGWGLGEEWMSCTLMSWF